MQKDKSDFRIAFVNLKAQIPCYFAGSSFTLEHIGLGYLSSFLQENGYKTVIIDAATRDLSDRIVVQEILDFSPSIVGFSPTVATMESVIKISTLLKDANKDIHVCLGGQHATFLAEEILINEPYIDSVIRGEGEWSILELSDRLRLKSPLRYTFGLYFRERDGRISKGPNRSKIEDLDSIPFPSRDSLRWQVENGKSPTARFISSRGCIADCSFCSIPPFERLQKGKLWRSRSPKDVLDELTYLKEEFGIKTVLFAEDNFIGPGEAGRERVRQIAQGMITRGLDMKFRILCMAESLINCESILPLMKKAGLDRVIVGIESASQSALNVLNKKTTLNDYYHVIRILEKNNIVLHMGFMMFQPYSCFKGLRLNAEFLKRSNHACFFQHFSNRMELYPGVAIFKRLAKDEMIISKEEYKRGYLYRFVEQNVGKLARNLSPIRRNMLDLDRLLLDTDIRINNEDDELLKKNLVDQYRELRNQISTKNMDFFLRSVEVAESGWKQNVFDELKYEYLEEIEKTGNVLISLVESA
ncbi:MAG: radical SAM protein [Thermodesulfobacteriota bacterium]|nr:radical SAM protein [Thermodesulfobacteriota bacterium]